MVFLFGDLLGFQGRDSHQSGHVGYQSQLARSCLLLSLADCHSRLVLTARAGSRDYGLLVTAASDQPPGQAPGILQAECWTVVATQWYLSLQAR